ncbi:MAG: GAF domain-containing protein [Proteobacteria bacterium]|nr:GAF domain-containing protein [Pseudomonadota bacterium]
MSASEIRFGEVDLTTCDREPIHIPGSIQPHGVLLVLDRRTLVVEQWAGDTRLLLGLDAAAIAGAALDSILERDEAAAIGSQLRDGEGFVAPAMRLGSRAVHSALPLDITLHALDGTAILELEPARRTATAAGDAITQLKSLLAAIQGTASVDESCARAARALRVATGFDRAMVYRFMPDESGEIVAEDMRAGLESYLGLHYPASDIPRQARELYRRNWLRVIPDIGYTPAPLTPARHPRSPAPLDMSHCSLRSVSPIHIEYLQNMGVSASLSASIICRNALWGMLVLHHYAPRFVAADLRVACETFAQIFSLHVESKSQAESSARRLESRRVREELVANLAGVRELAPVVARWDLLGYVGASGALVLLDGAWHFVGRVPPRPDCEALVRWLNTLDRRLYAVDCLVDAYPPAAAFPEVASGLLAVGLSREPRDYVVWFRPEVGHTVRWAGDPHASKKVGPLGSRLTPRGSFAEWLEVTRQQSAAWSEIELESAEALRVVLLECVLRNVDLAQREHAIAEARATAEELERRVAARTLQLRELAADLEAAEERERRQIATDLHDDLGQTLAAAQIRLAALRAHPDREVAGAAQALTGLVDRAALATRSLAAQLAPMVLHELGLAAALEVLGEEIGQSFGLRVRVSDDGVAKPLSAAARSILYRATRELLINAAKHARTHEAVVSTRVSDGRLEVRVEDAGAGYDPAAAAPGRRHARGLATLRERLTLVGGAMQVETAPGRGTRVLLTAPLGEDAPEDEDEGGGDP